MHQSLQFLAAAASLLGTASVGRAQQFPFGHQHQAYRVGVLAPANYTRAEQNDHVRDYYDVWKGRWLAPDPVGDGWRVKLNPAGETVSEGQGYGMVIVAAMAGHDPQAREIFDGLWQYRLAHPSEIDPRLMDWKQPLDSGNNSAFDGDMDIAYGLLMADAQWGSAGATNYLAEARKVIAGIRESTIGPQSKLPMLGDWVTADGAGHNQWGTRSSDFMPGHFRAFGEATGDEAFWNSVIAATQAVAADIQAGESAASGLLPDFIKLSGVERDPQPAPEGFLEGEHDDDYWYNAGRVPWRLGTDAVLNGDPATLAQVQKMSQWARTSTGGNADKIRGGYRLDGAALNTWSDHFFIAPFAVAAMTGSGTSDQAWLDSLYERVHDAHAAENYYADAVTLQSLLVVTGNFWDPTIVYPGPPPRPGDFNGDGVVDQQDMAKWRRDFGKGAGSDADGDGDTDGDDFQIWQQNLGTVSGALPPSLPTPEPEGVALAIGAVLLAPRVVRRPTPAAADGV